MKKELQKIANTLVLYCYHIAPHGLLEGKMGLILFLYRYARYASCTYYSHLADELLDHVLASVAHTSTDFENGLAGIGWTVNTLIKKRYLGGDPNDVLQDVDKRVFTHLKCDPYTSVFGQGIYLLERLKDNPTDAGLEEQIVRCLDFCEKGMKAYKGSMSLYHINSVLFFLITVEKRNVYDQVHAIKTLLPGILGKIVSENLFDPADLYICKQLLETIVPERKKSWKEIRVYKPKKAPGSFTIETEIKIAWLEELYFGKSTLKKISRQEVADFVNRKQESLTLNDFVFSSGLAGLGNRVLLTNDL